MYFFHRSKYQQKSFFTRANINKSNFSQGQISTKVLFITGANINKSTFYHRSKYQQKYFFHRSKYQQRYFSTGENINKSNLSNINKRNLSNINKSTGMQGSVDSWRWQNREQFFTNIETDSPKYMRVPGFQD